MVRNSRVEFHDDVPRPLIALGNDFPDGHIVLAHKHRRHQLLSGATGAILVSTSAGSWLIPPGRGVWIPAGTVHEVRLLGAVSLCSLYLEPPRLHPPVPPRNRHEFCPLAPAGLPARRTPPPHRP